MKTKWAVNLLSLKNTCIVNTEEEKNIKVEVKNELRIWFFETHVKRIHIKANMFLIRFMQTMDKYMKSYTMLYSESGKHFITFLRPHNSLGCCSYLHDSTPFLEKKRLIIYFTLLYFIPTGLDMRLSFM